MSLSIVAYGMNPVHIGDETLQIFSADDRHFSALFGQGCDVTDKLQDIAGALFAGEYNMFVGQRFALPGRNVVFLELWSSARREPR